MESANSKSSSVTGLSTRKSGRLFKVVLPVLVLFAAWGVAKYIKATKPEPVTRPSSTSVVAVDATRLQPTQYPVTIRSQGTVEPTYANTLVPEVAGTITAISDAFVVGGMFEQGEILLQIDTNDYEISLAQANANLAQAEAQLLEQSALAERAEADWQSLGRPGTPSALTLRKPQLAAAQANRDAAFAQVQRANLDLQRTRILAPYQGIVSERSADPGQFVARGSQLGKIYSVHAMDVKLPLSNRQLTYLDIPDALIQKESAQNTTVETAAGVSATNLAGSRSGIRAKVELQAMVGKTATIWTGKLLRTEGVDAATQQLNLIAQIQDPLTQNPQPLRVGQFVQALIEGQVLDQVFVIPRSALREEREVLLIESDQTIRRQPVTVAWSDDEVAAIDSGLEAGALLVTTPMSTVADGTPVRATVDGVAPEPLERKNKSNNAGQRLN